MTDSPQPTAGSLSAIVIRACREHGPTCELHRTVEDLGVVASFGFVDTSVPIPPSAAEPQTPLPEPPKTPSALERMRRTIRRRRKGI